MWGRGKGSRSRAASGHEDAPSRSEPLLSPEIERRLTGIRFNFAHFMDGRLTGVHRSAQPGVSVEFSDHKEYSPGDDIRRLNWKLLARSDKFYVRQFAKDTHANVCLVLDRSGSMDYHSDLAQDTKVRYASRLALILSYLFLRQNDAVGLLAVRGRHMETFVPPRSHPSHLLNIQDYLEDEDRHERTRERQEGPTSLAEGLEYLISGRVARSAVIVLSDLFVKQEELFPYLAYLKSSGNFVSLIQVLDPAEYDFGGEGKPRTFPFQGSMLFRSNETGHGIMMDSRLARPEYVRKFSRFLDGTRHRCAEYGIGLSQCNTDDDPVKFILEVLSRQR